MAGKRASSKERTWSQVLPLSVTVTSQTHQQEDTRELPRDLTKKIIFLGVTLTGPDGHN